MNRNSHSLQVAQDAADWLLRLDLEFDPEREITVTCGSTEGMIASLLAISNPGDEVIIFEPFYENFGPDTLLCGANRKFVRLHPPEWNFDPQELRAAFSKNTKAVIINSPGNPTGHLFSRAQLEKYETIHLLTARVEDGVCSQDGFEVTTGHARGQYREGYMRFADNHLVPVQQEL